MLESVKNILKQWKLLIESRGSIPLVPLFQTIPVESVKENLVLNTIVL